MGKTNIGCIFKGKALLIANVDFGPKVCIGALLTIDGLSGRYLAHFQHFHQSYGLKRPYLWKNADF